MGFLKNLIVGYYAVKTHNATKQPTVTAPPGWQVVGLEQKGSSRRWKVIYRANNHPRYTNNYTSSVEIHPRLSAFGHGNERFTIHWP